jgi:asparagine synthase (glutamine-hydrolysing)
MAARGPDGAGEWWDLESRVGLGHRRLSIMDLSDRALQPMTSECGRYVIVFNGEIYNNPELRRSLEANGCVFRTTSDTETLLHLYAAKGADMVGDLRGMFAFSIWDNLLRQLILARDPYGIKPLYVSDDGSTFRFASQVKALLAGGKVSRIPDPAGIVGFHIWGSVPEPFTLYRSISPLPAGHLQIITDAGPRPPAPFASIAEQFCHGAANPTSVSDVGARLREATLASVRSHLLADVEVGVFLSAGVDSGAILGLMRDAGQARIRAITLAFEEYEGTAEDESPVAAQVARNYGAEHVIRRVSEAEFKQDLDALLRAMDQPSIDGVNTWFVAKAAREAGLKVALSGVGGDELLAGYPSFRQVPRMVSALRFPASIPGAGDGFRFLVGALRLAKRHPKTLGILKFGGTYPGAYLLRRALYLPFELDAILDPDLVKAGLQRLMPLQALAASELPLSGNAVSRIATFESTNYLRNQLLRDADWAGMAHGLEIRTPLVDFDLLRAVALITPSLKPGAGKLALATAPSKPLPQVVSRKRKTGFTVPVGRWMAAAAGGSLSKGLASREWARAVYTNASVGIDHNSVATVKHRTSAA